MSRSVGPAGILDIRSVGIYKDIRDQMEANDEDDEEKQENHNDADFKYSDNYDRCKDWFQCSCAACICAVVLGALHFLPLLNSRAKHSYRLGILEVVIISTATYAIAFILSPLVTVLVRCMGHRLTCIFGLLLLFAGLLFDALEIHSILYYAAHLGFIGFGSSCALTAATCSVVPNFRSELRYALAVMSLAGPVGTIVLHASFYIFSNETGLTYKWIVIIVAVLVLVCLGLTHVIPSSLRHYRHPNPFAGEVAQRTTKDCIADVSRDMMGSGDRVDCLGNVIPRNENEERTKKSYLCICVLDVSALSDMSFMLWAIASSSALVTFYVPYVFVPWYVSRTYRLSMLEQLYLIIWLCLASCAGRIYISFGAGPTFFIFRTVFQIGLFGSAVVYLLLCVTETFGWFVVWSMAAGLVEGMIAGVIPRLTLLTIPREYIGCCWVYIILFNGVSVFIGPYLLMAVRHSNAGDITLACVAICIIQICGVILAFFLPEENSKEEEEQDEGFETDRQSNISFE